MRWVCFSGSDKHLLLQFHYICSSSCDTFRQYNMYMEDCMENGLIHLGQRHAGVVLMPLLLSFHLKRDGGARQTEDTHELNSR